MPIIKVLIVALLTCGILAVQTPLAGMDYGHPIALPDIALLQAHVSVLEYHQIQPANTDNNPYTVTSAHFEDQVREIIRAHRPVITARDLVVAIRQSRPIAPNSVIITFDDGYEGVYQYAYPILKHYGLPFTLFIIGNDVIHPNIGAGHITYTQLSDMAKNGVDVESHTYDLHPPARVTLIKANEAKMEQDFRQEGTLLSQLENLPSAIAYPEGEVPVDRMAPVFQHYEVAFVGSQYIKGVPLMYTWPRVMTSDRSEVKLRS